MARLLSRTQHVPGSFQFLQPETGQKKPFVGSFDFVVAQVMTMRRGNRFLSQKHGWATDRAGVEADVENYNVQRCLQHGWTNFLILDAAPAPPPERDIPDGGEGKKKAPGVVDGGSKLAAGIGVLLKWVGPSGKVVAPELANQRAAVCKDCPKNRKMGLTDFFTEAAAKLIRVQMEMKSDMKLRTAVDADLGICEACGCVTSLKAWVPLPFVLDGTTDEIRKSLDLRCWITAEERQNQK